MSTYSSFSVLFQYLGTSVVRWVTRLAGLYLELVAGRCRSNALRAVAFDLKTYFLAHGLTADSSGSLPRTS